MPSNLSLGSASASTQNFQTSSNNTTSSSNVTFSGTTQINNYYHVYNGQVVDVMKTEFGNVPRVVEGALPPKKLIVKPRLHPLLVTRHILTLSLGRRPRLLFQPPAKETTKSTTLRLRPPIRHPSLRRDLRELLRAAYRARPKFGTLRRNDPLLPAPGSSRPL